MEVSEAASTRFLLRESRLAASVVLFLGAGEGEVRDEYA